MRPRKLKVLGKCLVQFTSLPELPVLLKHGCDQPSFQTICNDSLQIVCRREYNHLGKKISILVAIDKGRPF